MEANRYNCKDSHLEKGKWLTQLKGTPQAVHEGHAEFMRTLNTCMTMTQTTLIFEAITKTLPTVTNHYHFLGHTKKPLECFTLHI